jgi:hypothetical protein
MSGEKIGATPSVKLFPSQFAKALPAKAAAVDADRQIKPLTSAATVSITALTARIGPLGDSAILLKKNSKTRNRTRG